MEAASVMDMIMDLRENLTMEIRPNSRGLEYLEAVIGKKDLESLKSFLTKHLGPAAKEPGIEANFPAGIRGLVDAIGGLRIDQGFFYRQEGNNIFYAVLWPWESNPEKITLKAGMRFRND
jgi:hypothetical protein